MADGQQILILDEWEVPGWNLRLVKLGGAIQRVRLEYRTQGGDGEFEWSPFWNHAKEATFIAERYAALLAERHQEPEGGQPASYESSMPVHNPEGGR